MIGVIGLLLAIVFLMVFAYKGLGALPLAVAGALVVIAFNGMNVWETITGCFVPGYTSAFTSYMVLFVTSAFYAKLMTVEMGYMNDIRNARTVRTVHPWEIDQAYAVLFLASDMSRCINGEVIGVDCGCYL